MLWRQTVGRFLFLDCGDLSPLCRSPPRLLNAARPSCTLSFVGRKLSRTKRAKDLPVAQPHAAISTRRRFRSEGRASAQPLPVAAYGLLIAPSRPSAISHPLLPAPSMSKNQSSSQRGNTIAK